MDTLTCYRCTEPVAVTAHCTMRHTSGRTDHPVAILVPGPTPAGEPVAHIVDHGAHFATYVDDRIEGRPWRLLGTSPTWRGAQYAEARAMGYAEGLASARERAGRYCVDPDTLPVESCCDLGICTHR